MLLRDTGHRRTIPINMRDIRAGLRERLDAIAKERAVLRTRLSEAESQEAAIRALLKQEEAKFGKLEPILPFSGILEPSDGDTATVRGRTPLSQMILNYLVQNAGRPVTLQDFKAAAEHVRFDFGQKAPGRVLHWALVGMEENQLVRKTEKGYTLAEMPPSSLNPTPPEASN
jgi:hypothetical protein